MKFKCQKCR